ncbi:MAG: 3-dehydroquinate synthase [Lentisphaeria bacterium]|nr:3-dehydroquinate synthase [Lentisphaeria bacterium]
MSDLSIPIRSSIRNYQADICSDTGFFEYLSSLPDAALLVDRNVYDLYRELFDRFFKGRAIFLFDALEANKNLEYLSGIYSWLVGSFAAKRNLNFISVGGGITQDVSGFAASTLYRGVKWYFVPTTLLAQVDSCIGGKTSLNFGSRKNLLGTFYPPHRLFIYPGFQKTLKELDRYSGYGEIVKFLLMDGFEKGSVSHVPGRMKDIVGSDGDLAGAVADCLRIKCAFMEDDEFDMGRRNLLNYGHCFGHALEAASGYFVPHGIAVNIGIIFANIVAVMRGRISQEFNDMIREEICLPFIFQEQRVIDYNGEKLLESLKNDKKRTGSGLPVVIPCDGGLEKIADLTFEEFYIALDILKKVLFP